MTVSRLLLPRRRWSAMVAVLLIVGVGSCGTPGAAEPAKAPPVTTTPALAVADELGGAFVLVRDGRAVHRFTDVTQPGGLAAVGEQVGVVDVRERTLTLYDTRRAVRLRRLPAGDGPTHMVSDRRGHLLVVDTQGDRILTFEIAPRLNRSARRPCRAPRTG